MVTGPIQIHLIRHGEVHNPNRILYGRLPRFRLNQNGRRQARAAGVHLDGCPIDALFSSPMLRARQTAREIIRYHPHLRLRVSELINEVRTSFEGRPGAEIDARNGDVYSGGNGGSEQPLDIVHRTRRFIHRVGRQYTGGQVAAVTHGDVITFIVLWARGFDPTPRNKNRLLQAGYPVAYPAHASITTLTYRAASPEEKPGMTYCVPGKDLPIVF
jgi:broad specificity phosphatase PhoE